MFTYALRKGQSTARLIFVSVPSAVTPPAPMHSAPGHRGIFYPMAPKARVSPYPRTLPLRDKKLRGNIHALFERSLSHGDRVRGDSAVQCASRRQLSRHLPPPG
jgi:hypothetical protein